MNKTFGDQSNSSNFPFKDLQETIYNQDGIEVEVKDGSIAVGVDDKSNLEKAKELACLLLAAWSERQECNIHVECNHTWEKISQDNQNSELEQADDAKAKEPIQAQVTTHQMSIPTRVSLLSQQMIDAASFTNDRAMFHKAQQYPALKSALTHYHDEIIDNEMPLYGCYKAIEAMAHYLGSNKDERRKLLAQIAGKNLSYVSDIIQSAEVKGHDNTTSSKRLEDDECRRLTKILLDACANALP